MKHIFINLYRRPKNTLLVFGIVFIVLFMEMFGGFIGTVCNEMLEKTYGPLIGYYQVDTADVFTYDGIKYVTENVDNIEEFHSICIKTGWLYNSIPDEEGHYSELSYFNSAITRVEKGAFAFECVTSCDIAEEVYSGKYVLTKGRWITREDDDTKALAIVVSDVTAEMNGLDIGSTVRFKSDKSFEVIPVVYGYDLNVVGIYHCNEPDNSAYATVPSAVNTNLAFIPLSILENETVGKFYRSTLRNEDIFPQRTYLKLTPGTDPDELTDTLLALGIRDFVISEFSGTADSSPIVTMSNIVRYCAIAVLAAGALMLIVITVLTMHSRKREISILCALGKRRSAVTLQLVGEFAVIFVFSVAFAIGLFSALISVIEPVVTSYLNVSQETAKIVNTSTITYNPGVIPELVAVSTPFSELFVKYVKPNAILAAATGAVELFVISLLTWIYIKNTEVLTTLGGKV